MIRKIAIWIIALIIIAGLVVGGIHFKDKIIKPSPSPTSSPTPDFDHRLLTIGIDSRPTGMLFYAANHFIPTGKFRIKPILLEDPNERWSRMEAGALDMSFATFPEFVLGASRCNPGKLISFISSSRGCDGIAVSGNINSIDNLVGKKVAVVPGSAGHYFLIRTLDSKARSTSEITIIPAPTTDDAFNFFIKGGNIDSAALSQPYLSRSVDAGKRIFVSTRNFFTIDEIICASDFALEHRKKDIQDVLNAYFNLVYLIRTNPGLAKSLITKQSGRSIEEVETLLNCVSMMDIADSRAVSRESIEARIQKVQQIWDIEGLPNAKGKIRSSNIIDYSLLDNATVNKTLFDETKPPEIPDISPTPETSPTGIPVITPSAEASPTKTPAITPTTKASPRSPEPVISTPEVPK
ncbi:MAG: hypothetical protein K8T10_13310 [Candidatus Eremiobacteraeota bacterium]|nr:hypothetical protein [Candidatus Eremiobacteraeota bacterium]